MTELPQSYDIGFVIASVIIAVWASFVALEVSARMLESARPLGWAMLAAVIWGSGIWLMHFCAMLAFHTPVDIRYDLTLTAISLILPIVTAWLGFWILLQRKLIGRRDVAAVGAVFGTAVVLMHFGGMESMVMSVAMEHNLAFVYASYGIAIAAATAAVGLVFLYPGSETARRVAALPLGLAIAGMHYCSMLGLTVYTGSGHRHFADAVTIGREGLGLWIVLVAGIVLTAGGLIATARR